MLSRFFLFFVSLFFSFSNASAQWVELENLPSWGINTSYKMGDVLWVGTSNGLYSSVDTGRTFRMEEALPRGLSVMSIQELGEDLLVFCNQLIQEQNRLILCKTADKGETWKIVDVGLNPCIWVRYFVIGDKIYIPSCQGPNLIEFYRSDDKGETFHLVSMQPQFNWMAGQDSILVGITTHTLSVSRDYGLTFQEVYVSSSSSYNNLRQVFLKDSVIFATQSLSNFLISRDLGSNWDTVPHGFGTTYLWETSGSDLLYLSSDNDVLCSKDFGATWDTIGTTFPENTKALYQFENQRIAWSGTAIYIEKPDGSWQRNIQGVFNSSIWGLCYADSILLGSIHGKISLSEDMARSWKGITLSPAPFIYGLAIRGGHIYLSNSNGVFVSNVGEISWKQIYFDKIGKLIPNKDGIYFTKDFSLYRIQGEDVSLISNNLPSHLWGFGRDDSGYWLLSGLYELYYLSDNSANWEYKSRIINAQVLEHIDIVISESRMLIPAYGRVFYSDDSGATWQSSSMPLADFHLTNPGMIVTHENDLYLAAQSTYTGVMVSHDKGETWSFFNENLGNTHIERLVVADNLLFANVENSGLWARSLKGALASGKVFSDENSNQIFDRQEKPVANIPVVAQPSNKATRTDANGFYLLEVPLGDTLSVVTASMYDEVEPDLAIVSDGAFRQDFAIQPKDLVHDEGVFIGLTNELNQLNTVTFKLSATNSGTTLLANSQLVLHLPRNWKFYKASLNPKVVETDSVRWDLTNLEPGKSITIQVEAVILKKVPGQSERIFARIYSDHSDDYPFNNTFIREYPPDLSPLPLSKEVYPAPFLSPNYVTSHQRLEYSIIFDYPQASGPSFTIVDTLSSHLDLKTFSLTYSDVPCSWEILDDRVVRFTFTPDGIPKQQRVVRFSIMPRKGLPVGTLIKNIAVLEHPQMAAWLSNPAIVEINYPLPEWNPSGDPKQLQCYPNPATDFSIITWAVPLQGDGVLEVFNTMGQLLVSHQIRYGFSQFQIPLEAFPAGQYFVRLVTEKERYVGKLIVK